MTARSSYLEHIIATQQNSACNMQVVFVDIVAYSKRKSHAQINVINAFQACLEAAIAATAEQFHEFLRDKQLSLRDNLILIPAGDGAAVGFPFGALRDAHLVFATALLTAIGIRRAAADCSVFRRNRGWCDCHDAMNVRIGISEGQLIVYKDINDNFNVAGTTVNVAARVMSIAQDNQIFFSEYAYRQILDMVPRVAARFIEYRDVEVKHGLLLNVYQYADKSVKYLASSRNQTRASVSVKRATDTDGPTTSGSSAPRSLPTKANRPLLGSNRSAPANPLCRDVVARLVEIPPGTCIVPDKPDVTLVITRRFAIDRLPMTQDVFRQVLGHCASHFQGNRLPVDSVTWFEAVAFCNALSRLCEREEVYRIDGKRVEIDYSASGFRLPTETEWEYSCGDGGLHANPRLDRIAWYSGNTKQTRNAGELQPNTRGLHDMLGNVWEWCNDWFAKKRGSSGITDPTGPPQGLERVMRGGSWNDLATTVSPAYRARRDPSWRASNVGFRIALTIK